MLESDWSMLVGRTEIPGRCGGRVPQRPSFSLSSSPDEWCPGPDLQSAASRSCRLQCCYRRGPESWNDTAPPVWCGYKRCPLPICGWDCPPYVQIVLARCIGKMELVEKSCVGSDDLIYRTVSYISGNFRRQFSLDLNFILNSLISLLRILSFKFKSTWMVFFFTRIYVGSKYHYFC